MTETEFRHRAAELGYGDPKVKEYPPNVSGELHTHDFSAYAMVEEGEFILEYEDGEVVHRAGECCEVPAGTRHSEKTGAAGAKVWFATR